MTAGAHQGQGDPDKGLKGGSAEEQGGIFEPFVDPIEEQGAAPHEIGGNDKQDGDHHCQQAKGDAQADIG